MSVARYIITPSLCLQYVGRSVYYHPVAMLAICRSIGILSLAGRRDNAFSIHCLTCFLLERRGTRRGRLA
jgi:hypothetical protein